MLAGFLAYDRDDHPLLYLKQFLVDQLGLTLPQPEPAGEPEG
jgi:hypothetical protein